MPELPDIVVYVESLEERILGETLERVRLAGPFLLRSVTPRLEAFEGRRVEALGRLGKRIVIGLEGDLFLVLHLMIAGRLHWKERGAGLQPKLRQAAFDFASGSLVLTEAGTKKRASLHAVAGPESLAAHDPGGLEILEADLDAFGRVLRSERHTLKRSLTDPTLFSGIGNAYSDEILHRARLSPFKLSDSLSEEESARLFEATRGVLKEWTDRLRAERGDGFPTKVTAFREGMAVHGRYRESCPDCGAAVQRIVYSENEANYCPGCQTQGKLLADRALSRLLRDDWPRTVEALESRMRGGED